MDDYSDIPQWQPKQSGKTWREGYVYVIDYGDGKTFKIGHTTDSPDERLHQIARGDVIMPMRLVMHAYIRTNCRLLETLIQMQFDPNHVLGEWFRLNFAQLIEVYSCLKGFGDSVELEDRWFELVPDDYDRYLHGAAEYELLPYCNKEDRDNARKAFWKEFAQLIDSMEPSK